MQRLFFTALFGLFIATILLANPGTYLPQSLPEVLTTIDQLHYQDEHKKAQYLVRYELNYSNLCTEDKALLLTRQARAIVAHVELYHHANLIETNEACKQLDDAIEYAAEAISLKPDLAEAYFWKGAAIGLRGRIRGIFSSLFMAGNMRDYVEAALERNPYHTESHFILSQLYDELPGRPISFGDDVKAVSLSRRAYDLHFDDYKTSRVNVRYNSVTSGLAERLWSRNWSSKQRERFQPRLREDFRNAESELERSYTYEGSLNLKPISDREEARWLLSALLEELEAIENPSRRENNDLNHVRNLAQSWGL